MKTAFRKFGVMVDCSRNAVMTVDVLKKFIAIIAKMGYNQVHLYMEDTYEVDGEKQFGYLRGKYTKEELKQLDDFSYELGVELVPNIQTLAHMTAFTRWRKDIIDTNDILLVGDEKVYDLITRMFQSLRECFRTKNIHIGMDEAHMLGRGKYYDLNGPEDRFHILCTHLQKVCKIAEQFGFQPMMWSDMFYRIANGGDYYQSGATFDQSIKAQIPENVTLGYWDYYSLDKKRYSRMIKGHHQLTDKVMFTGGAWKWNGFVPNNDFSIKATKAAFDACKENHIQDVLLTMWGDNGAECSSFSVLPTLCYGACIAQGITKKAEIRAKFEEWVGCRFDDFMLLDLPDRIEKRDKIITPAKYFLYSDCFMSIFQNLEKEEYTDKYAAFARKLKAAAKRSGEYAYLFDTAAKLCDVLAIKQNICSRAREAYASADAQLLDSVISDYRKMIKRTEQFYYAFRKQWYFENKPSGFEVQDIRIGGLIQRMRSCMDRLVEYRAGKISAIPELEEKIIPFAEDHIDYNYWIGTCTTNVI